MGAAHDVPVIFCKAGQRKHLIAEEYLAAHEITEPGVPGAGREGAGHGVAGETLLRRRISPTWRKKSEYVNHYSFTFMDPEWVM